MKVEAGADEKLTTNQVCLALLEICGYSVSIAYAKNIKNKTKTLHKIYTTIGWILIPYALYSAVFRGHGACTATCTYFVREGRICSA